VNACSNSRQMRKLIDRHFSGRISPADERTLRIHLPTCPGCSRYYERHLLLAQLDPKAMSSQERIGRGLAIRSNKRPIGPIWIAVVGATAFAAFLALANVGLFERNTRAVFTARGPAADATARLAARIELFVYRIRAGRPPELATDSIARSDELAFAYRNRSEQRWLLVFGIDEHQNVYWYYPKWIDSSRTPVAVPLRRGGQKVELSEAIHHQLRGKVLRIYGVFSRTRLSVTDIERLARTAPGSKLPIPDAVQRITTLSVRSSVGDKDGLRGSRL
jgi:hypothetical protein